MNPSTRTGLLLILLSGVISFSCPAQQVNTPFQRFTVDEGLPQNYVLGLAQDSAGFIWIGTKDGLARYDGYHFMIYRHGKDSIHTPAANYITNLCTDHHGYLWIQYDNRAIDRYDPSTGVFDHISNQRSWDPVRSQIVQYELLLDHHDNLWLLTENDGFYRYNTRSKTLSPISGPPQTAVGNASTPSTRGITEDHEGKIWMLTPTAFKVYDYSNDRQTTIPFQLSTRQTYSGRNYNLGIGELSDGKILVTSLDSAMLVYDPGPKTFLTPTPHPLRHIAYDAGLGNTNPVLTGNGDRWLTCNGKIFKVDHATNEISEIPDPSQPAQPDASALLIDRSGNLWFGKNAQGLCKVNLKTPRFISKKYADGNFETDIMLDEMGVSRNELPAGFDKAPFGYMFRNALDKANNVVWIQNYLFSRHSPNLLAYDIITKKISKIDLPDPKNGEVGVSIDSIGNAWLLGINEWTPVKMGWKNRKATEQIIDVPSQTPDSLFKAGKVGINPVYDKDSIWVMASNASIDFGAWTLVSINFQSKRVLCHPLNPDNTEPTSNLLMMINDPSNPEYLWIGSTGNGLIRFDKRTGKSHAFTTDEGLPNNTIYAIVPDNNNNLWLSSNKGISRFNPVTHTIRNFDIADGLAGNEFNRWHCFQLPDGRIAFGGVNGYTIFNPSDIKDDDFQPRTLLTNLLIDNKPLADIASATGSKSLSDTSLNALHNLVLPHDQNFLSFEFASDEFNFPQKISYRYRLVNFDNDWVYSRNERFANYTKLPPGHYTLEINASNNSGVWSNAIKTLQVVIIPAWWQTWWANTIYLLLAVGLLLTFFYYRIRRIRLAQRMILQQKQTEQLKALDEMKSRFFSNITHEFRTPLSLIISPVEKLQREAKDEQTHKTLSTIRANANRLLQLINQLLDLSKLDAGSMHLNFFRGRLDAFIEEMVGLLLPLAERKQTELTCHCDLSPEYLFDADKLKTILFNLLSNALKFTPAGGRIAITATEDEDAKIRIVIRDSGIGIPADKLPFIFDRFFQADDSRSRSYEGTGIGLALVKELVELMHGTVTAESRPEAGTSITLVFPAEKAGNATAPQWRTEMEPGIIHLPHNAPVPAIDQSVDLPLLLLVEDNEELLAFLRESFEQNFRVLTAGNGSSALQLAKEELPDLVISDVMMPVMDGFALCRELKSDKITGHIGVILLTAKISYESRLGGLQLGADDYISKPFHIEELETRVRNILSHQEKQRQNYRLQLQQKDTTPHANGAENPFLKSIYAIIDDMIDDPQLGASKLAEKNAMSLRTLNRKLNATIGLTAGDLIRQYRLQKSLLLLKEGKNVSEAAYLVGFESPAYFSQCFKDQYGVSPSQSH